MPPGVKEDQRNGNRHREVVQRVEGLWIHRARRRRQGRFLSSVGDPRDWFSLADRRSEGRVRHHPGSEGSPGRKRPTHLTTTTKARSKAKLRPREGPSSPSPPSDPPSKPLSQTANARSAVRGCDTLGYGLSARRGGHVGTEYQWPSAFEERSMRVAGRRLTRPVAWHSQGAVIA